MSEPDLDPETTARTLTFTLALTDREFDALRYWVGEIERETRFVEEDVLAACRVMHEIGLRPALVIASLRAVSAFAHATDAPMEAVAEQIGLVMELADMHPAELPAVLDVSEELARERDLEVAE